MPEKQPQKKTAELLINGPRGFSHVSVQVMSDGLIERWAAEAALAHALNLYNDLPEVKGNGQTQSKK